MPYYPPPGFNRADFEATQDLAEQIRTNLGAFAADYRAGDAAKSLHTRFGPGPVDLRRVPQATYREVLLRCSTDR